MNRAARDAILDALQFQPVNATSLPRTDGEWKAALAYCDRYQLTLPFARRLAPDACPPWVRERLESNAAANRVRIHGILQCYAAIRERLQTEHLVLKGFTLAPDFCPDAGTRVQYDLDLYARPAGGLESARDALVALGYEPLGATSRFPADHLPPMTRKTGWQWRGDFFDAEIPLTVELHFRFWDRSTERFGPMDLESFWARRRKRELQGVTFESLHEVDALGYACLHALRHLLRGDARPAHFYEIAWFLDRQRDPSFWLQWREWHPDTLRRIEAICFRFAREWFGCTVPDGAADAAIPEGVAEWFKHFGKSPLDAGFRPNKDELWLHWELLESWPDKAAIARRKLLPVKPPGPVDAVHLPADQMTFSRRALQRARWLRFTGGRVLHHSRALLPALRSGLQWTFVRRGFSPGFGKFFAGFLLYNAAMMLFHLLYNLHLAGLGLREDLIGRISGSMTLGSMLGSLAASFVVVQLGLRGSLMACFVSQGAISAVRVFATSSPLLLGSAFLSGVSHALFAVGLSPMVASLCPERHRPFAFSLTLSSGISLGIVAGLVGGRLPALLHSTENVLLLACGLAALAALPLIGIAVNTTENEVKTPAKRGFFVPDRSLALFLAALSLWSFATGLFNPFFNVYLARGLRFPVETIGLLFTVSQLSQAIAMQFSPLVLRVLGLTRGIAVTQALAGVALIAMGAATPVAGAILFPVYMSLQFMTEPGIFTRLMSGLPEQQRAGASAWNFALLFATHALAAWAGGEAIARFGYSPVWYGSGLLILFAAWAMARVTAAR